MVSESAASSDFRMHLPIFGNESSNPNGVCRKKAFLCGTLRDLCVSVVKLPRKNPPQTQRLRRGELFEKSLRNPKDSRPGKNYPQRHESYCPSPENHISFAANYPLADLNRTLGSAGCAATDYR